MQKQPVLRRLRRRAIPLVGAVKAKIDGVRTWGRALRPARLLLALAFALLTALLLLTPLPGSPHLPLIKTAVPMLLLLGAALVVGLGRRFHPALGTGTRRLCVIGLTTALALIGLRIDQAFSNSVFAGTGAAELLCVTAGAAMLTLLIDAQVAVLCAGVWIAVGGFLVVSPAASGTHGASAAAFLSVLIVILFAAKIRCRTDVARIALVLTTLNLVVCALTQSLVPSPMPWHAIGWTILASLGAVACFSGGVTLLERPLGLITHLGLLELSDLNRPLLRRFAAEAPGTYAHSLMAGNLAAAAAEAVGADPLLTRVAAYYHDLGKMRRASFFVENQEGDNIHERINPSLSAVVLTAHVREGLQIASEERLPPAIKDIIVQHHGTSLISYFYHQAAKSDGELHDSALEHRFRYPGPKPQTKEAAIMMLADGIEAASHTLHRPNRGRIEEFVQKMIDCKVGDGQLDESPLTLGDLKVLKETFVRVLCGMMHSRIEYPEPQKDAAPAAPPSLVPALLPIAEPTAPPSPSSPAARHETSASPEPVADAARIRAVSRRALTRTGRPRTGASVRTPLARRDAQDAKPPESGGADASSAPGIAGSGSYS